MITEKELLELKRKAEEGKQTYVRAQATLEEVNRNVEALKKELRDLGIDPENVEKELEDRKEEINKAYQEILAMFPEGQSTLI